MRARRTQSTPAAVLSARALGALAVIALTVLHAAPSAHAQDSPRALGNPTTGVAEESVPTAPPSAYDDTTVPPPPGAEGAQFPGAPQDGARRREMTTDSGERIPPAIATRLRALDSDFQVLAARGGGSIVDGILAILTGGVSIGIGAYLWAETGDDTATPFLFIYGGAGVVRGVLSFVFLTNPSGPAVQFAHMPMTNLEEVHQRLEYGERELAHLADQNRLSRILDGSLNVGVGLGIAGFYIGVKNETFGNDVLDWFMVIGAGISAVGGVVTLLTSTEAERRWSAYEELRDRLEARGNTADLDLEVQDMRDRAARRTELQPVVGGSSGGAVLGMTGTF